MAKRSGMYGFEKRSKEIKRKKKQDEKRAKRLNKDKAGGGPEIDYSLCTTAGAAGVDLTPLIEEQEAAAAAAAAEAADLLEDEDEGEEEEQG